MNVKSILLVVMLSGTSALAFADDVQADAAKVEFEQRYSAFQQALAEQAATEDLVELAKQSYVAGANYFGDSNINTANLKMSYLNLVPKPTLESEASRDLAQDILATYRATYEPKAPELIPALLMVLETGPRSYKLRQAEFVYDELIDVADANMDTQPEAMFKAKILAGAQLLRLGSRDSRYLTDFAEQADKQFGSTHELALLANFHAGRYLEAKGDLESAVEKFKRLTDAEALPSQLSYFKYVSHARLVNHLEALGESEAATEHCIAISNLGYGIGNEEQPKPLYRKAPEYPQSALYRNRDGSVKIQYDVTADGRVENIEILESSEDVWIETSREAIAKWRFAPRLENGEPVATTERKVIFEFEMAD